MKFNSTFGRIEWKMLSELSDLNSASYNVYVSIIFFKYPNSPDLCYLLNPLTTSDRNNVGNYIITNFNIQPNCRLLP